MKKFIITTFAFITFITVCSACNPPIEPILINGEENTTLYPGESITFSWNNTSEWNPNPPNPPILKVWRIGITPSVHEYPSPNNSLFVENGYNVLGDYMVSVPWYKCCGSNNLIYTGYFTIESKPYTGPVFVTHTTTLTVTPKVN